MAILEVNHIEKHFGSVNVLDDISFSLEKGQALSIIGSSGSGKTTLLSKLFSENIPGLTSWAEAGKAVYLKENFSNNIVQIGILYTCILFRIYAAYPNAVSPYFSMYLFNFSLFFWSSSTTIPSGLVTESIASEPFCDTSCVIR